LNNRLIVTSSISDAKFFGLPELSFYCCRLLKPAYLFTTNIGNLYMELSPFVPSRPWCYLRYFWNYLISL